MPPTSPCHPHHIRLPACLRLMLPHTADAARLLGHTRLQWLCTVCVDTTASSWLSSLPPDACVGRSESATTSTSSYTWVLLLASTKVVHHTPFTHAFGHHLWSGVRGVPYLLQHHILPWISAGGHYRMCILLRHAFIACATHAIGTILCPGVHGVQDLRLHYINVCLLHVKFAYQHPFTCTFCDGCPSVYHSLVPSTCPYSRFVEIIWHTHIQEFTIPPGHMHIGAVTTFKMGYTGIIICKYQSN